MTRHKRFANPHGSKVFPLRDFLGENMPSGRDGFIIEDLDLTVAAPEESQLLVVRRFGDRFGLDATGEFLIAEFKYRPDLGTWLDEAQKRTFGLINDQCTLGDQARSQLREPTRYCGFYVVAYNEPTPTVKTQWCVRDIGRESSRSEPMDWAEFANWLQIVNIAGEAA